MNDKIKLLISKLRNKSYCYGWGSIDGYISNNESQRDQCRWEAVSTGSPNVRDSRICESFKFAGVLGGDVLRATDVFQKKTEISTKGRSRYYVINFTGREVVKCLFLIMFEGEVKIRHFVISYYLDPSGPSQSRLMEDWSRPKFFCGWDPKFGIGWTHNSLL